MTEEQFNAVNNRTDELEVDIQDIKAALNQLIDFTYQSQNRNQQQINALTQVSRETQEGIRSLTESVKVLAEAQLQTFSRIDEMQSEIRGIQTESRRILDFLLNQEPPEENEG
jgi:uncharacterized phage infection (PIP) family protein YhgE